MKEDNLQYLWKLGASVCKDVAIKCTATFLIVLSEFFIDGVMAKAMAGLFVLIIFDWFTGVMAAHKTGEHIKSSKLVRTPVKIAIYFMLITGARIAEYSLPDVAGILDEAIVGFLALTELISVIENTGKMGYVVPNKILKKLKSLRDE